MRKFVLVPIVKLGSEPYGLFLEVMSEPASFKGVHFQHLKNSGLASAVTVTQTILKRLACSTIAPNNLYLSNYFLNLSGLKSISLGLTLAVFMQQESCPYQKIIAIGEIEVHSPKLSVSGGLYFETQIAAILALGKQTYSVPLFLPKNVLNKNYKNLTKHLAELNIILKPVTNIYEALADFGIILKMKTF